MRKKRQYTQFVVEDADGFIWQGQRIGFDKIRHIFFSWVKVTADADKAYLRITLVDNRVIRLNFDNDILLSVSIPGRNEDIDNLKNLYLYLSTRSYEYRLSHYLQELQAKGYFTIDACRFYPDANIVRFREKVLPLASYEFLNYNGYIEIRKKNRTRWEIFTNGFSWHIPQFNTQTDPDVVFALLDKFFGLKW